MSSDAPNPARAATRAGGSKAPPGWTVLSGDHLPTATFWPAGLALGITFIFWGLISSWVVLVIGAGLFAVSLTGWITDIRHERQHHP